MYCLFFYLFQALAVFILFYGGTSQYSPFCYQKCGCFFFFHFGRKIIIVECAENAFEKHVSTTHGKETH